MIAKTFEVRDRMTFFPVLAIRLEPSDARDLFLLSRCGYGTTIAAQREYVLLARLDGSVINYDPFSWGDRTYFTAHTYIQANWDTLRNGEVIDVEYIQGETDAPKASEFSEVQH